MNPSRESYYEILGLEKTCSREEIKSSFKKLALIHHPDKGGDPTVFKKISEAYNILSDPVKRRDYDRGPSILNNMSDMSSIFNMMFSGGINFSGFKNSANIEPLYITKKVTLQDLYLAKNLFVEFKRYESCDKCTINICNQCNGSGVSTLNTGISISIPCILCRGIKYSIMCMECKNKGLILKDHTIEFKYCPNLESTVLTLTIKNEGHLESKFSNYRGDVIIRFDEDYNCSDDDKKNSTKMIGIYKRIGKDLHFTANITLGEALCGFNKDLLHVDGTLIKQSSLAGNIITPITKTCILGKGLLGGDLTISYDIKFPNDNFLGTTAGRYERLKEVLDM